MSQKTKKILVLVALFILPAFFFYLLVYTGKHKVNRLHFYGPKEIVQVEKRGSIIYDTTYHSIPFFQAQTLDNIPFTAKTLEGKIYLAHFLDMANLKDIPKEITYIASEILPTFPSILFVSYLENTTNDLNLQAPSERTKKLDGTDNRWSYVKVDSTTAQYLKLEGYFKPSPTDTVEYDPASIVLVDMEGRIRGYYNPAFSSDISNLKKEISLLYKEYELAFKTHKYIEFN